MTPLHCVVINATAILSIFYFFVLVSFKCKLHAKFVVYMINLKSRSNLFFGKTDFFVCSRSTDIRRSRNLKVGHETLLTNYLF